MHTDKHAGWVIHRNSDYSGDVELVAHDGGRFKVPFCVLFSLVAGYVRDRKLAALERASEREVMGLPED